MNRFPRSLVPALLGLLTLPLATVGTVAGQVDSVTVVPGERYRASALHRWLLGPGYRDLWTTPLRVEVLDLSSRGGLTPIKRGGNVQTMALRFRAADGSEYNFRSVDKELTPAMPEFAQETLLDFIRQDVTSAQVPLAPVIVTPLLDAVDVLNPAPRLVVLPDAPELGEFRDEYAGMLGTFEHHANEIEEGVGGFAGSVEVKSTDGMLDDVEDDPHDRADSKAFLTARLVDMLIGDWDRHEGQWRWARYDRDGFRWWEPIPEDRDYAFVDYGGVLLEGAKLVGLARLVSFDDEFASFEAMMANSLEMNRRLLADLDRPTWDSIAGFVQQSITDEVIASAVGSVPERFQDGSGSLLASRLRSRRDNIVELSRRFYAYMAEMVEVHSTDADEVATIQRYPDGRVDVTIATTQGLQVYRRSFDPSETEELRIDLHGGDDHAIVQGIGGEITVRILGGGGDDQLEDRGRGPTALYDSRGENRIVPGRNTFVDIRSYDPPEEPDDLLPSDESDWGTSVSISPVADWRSHVGVVVGGSISRTSHGFRQHPYTSRHSLTGLISPLKSRGALEYRGFMPRENSDRWLELRGDATSMNAVRFHGFGNATDPAGPESRVWLRELSFAALWHVPMSRSVELVTGPLVKHSDPSYDEDSPVATLLPRGAQPLGQLHTSASMLVDSRDDEWFPTQGVEAEVTGVVAPPLWDVENPYSRIFASAAVFLPLRLGVEPVLALRGGGARVWGDFPFQESAFLGGSHTLRGFQRERFAGDAMVFGNAELRVPLAEMELLVRGKLGISGLADAGRVYVDGDSPGGWHHAAGGSIWFATPALSVSATYAYGEDHRFYADIGLPF